MFNLDTCKNLGNQFRAEVTPLYQEDKVTGVHLKLRNSWTVSIQWGYGTYTKNRFAMEHDSCEDAEIAAWDYNDEWYDFGHDQVKGNCSLDDVKNFIKIIAAKVSPLN